MQADEYAVKGAFLLHFGRYAEWAPPPVRRPTGGFSICSLAKPYLAPAAAALERQKLKDKEVFVRVVSSAVEVAGCDVLFFGVDVVGQKAALNDAIATGRVLTVSDGGSLGMINFIVDDDGQVKFSVNLEPATRVGITFSSQLLKLAQRIEGEEE
jgi:hypothetical protein